MLSEIADGTARSAGYVGENWDIAQQASNNVNNWLKYPIICIDLRYPPALVRVLFADAQSFPLLPSVVQVPAFDLLFGGLRLIRESIEFLYPTELASPCFDTIVYISGLFLVG